MGSTEQLFKLKLVLFDKGTVEHEPFECGRVQLALEVGQSYMKSVKFKTHSEW